MVDINQIKSKKVLGLLNKYNGNNHYISYLKKESEKNSSFSLTENQIDYIFNNHDKEPILIDKIVKITTYLGEQLKTTHNLKHLPEKILIKTILGETDKTYHSIVKLYKNQKNDITLWLPKTQILDDIFFQPKEVDIDIDKYVKLDKLSRTPYEHQIEGIKFLLSRDGCILADDMGLGKTLMSIIAALETNKKRILIICPSSLKFNWAKEICNYCDENDVSIISGKEWNPSKFTIINYDILKNFHTIKEKGREYEDWELRREIIEENFDLVIADEAHYLKNPKSIRGKTLQDIISVVDINKVWLLTGTPIANRPMDFFNLLKLIKSPISNNWVFFAKRYCDGKRIKKKTKTGKLRTIWLTNGASNLEELHEKTKNYILRRKKEEVLDLPDKIITPYYLELENRVQYDNVFEEYLEWKRSEGKNVGLHRELIELTLLRKFLAVEKVKHTIGLVEDILEQDKKVIVFTNFKEELKLFMDHFNDNAVCVYGETKERDRQHAVDRFQDDDKIKIFVGNIKAAGVGLTLTSAEVVIINSLDWVPGNLEQAEDRAYRIGQTKNVNVFYPLFDNTVDTLVWDILQNKKMVINTIMGDVNDNIIEDIINAVQP